MAPNPPSTGDRPLVIGLLGGICAGKSTVAGLFAEHGFLVIDADAAARDAVAEPAVHDRIRQRFGPGVFDPAGELDRTRLARIVFDDPAARQDLESIVHPEVRRAILRELAAARERGQPVILDVPLLLEKGLLDACDHCVFIEVAPGIRQARARERGWDEAELPRREAAQATLAQKQARCGFTVGNGGELARTREEVATAVRALRG